MRSRHQCEYLKYLGRECVLQHPGEEGKQHWVLQTVDGFIVDQTLLFCPYCGEDFRADCWRQIQTGPLNASQEPRPSALTWAGRSPWDSSECDCGGIDEDCIDCRWLAITRSTQGILPMTGPRSGVRFAGRL